MLYTYVNVMRILHIAFKLFSLGRTFDPLDIKYDLFSMLGLRIDILFRIRRVYVEQTIRI